VSKQSHIEIWRMNAFTDTPFSGNPAGVVLDGDSLSDHQMQAIAPQLNNISETVYMCTPTEPSADISLRYFTSTTEVDLCGHATISALFALAASGRVTGQNEIRVIRAQTRTGVLDLGLEFVEGRLAWASMTQPIPVHQLPSAPQQAAEVLGLAPAGIRSDLPIACSNTGIWSCYVPLVDLDALAAISINSELIDSLWPENEQFAGVYPFVITSQDRQSDSLRTQGRFFSLPKYGIAEDPVTGTACGALGAYLIRQGVLSGDGELEAHQGVEMDSPGMLFVHQTKTGAMKIRGQAVSIYCGRLTL
jgi:trans-2,3-dihydro-3-hydroxyanthranilate isomerase